MTGKCYLSLLRLSSYSPPWLLACRGEASAYVTRKSGSVYSGYETRAEALERYASARCNNRVKIIPEMPPI